MTDIGDCTYLGWLPISNTYTTATNTARITINSGTGVAYGTNVSLSVHIKNDGAAGINNATVSAELLEVDDSSVGLMQLISAQNFSLNLSATEETSFGVPSVANLSDGTYYLITTISNDMGIIATNATTFTVRNNASPTASLSISSLNVGINVTVKFDASNSTGNITAYFFDFGDGNNSGWTTEPIVTHKYTARSLYFPKLKVKSSDGNESKFHTLSLFVGNMPPIAKLSASTLKSMPNQTVTFYASKSTDDGSVMMYYFNFEGGNASGWVTTPTITHSFENLGVYNVTLFVEDDEGLMSINGSVLKINITTTPNQMPVVSLGADKEAYANDTITFTATASDTDGQIISYEWDIDGNGVYELDSSGNTATHVYNTSGKYNASVRVTDNDLGVAIHTINVTIAQKTTTPPVADAGENIELDEGASITLNASASKAFNATIVKYEWDIDGDGVYEYSSTTPILSHTFNKSGAYSIKVRVTDSNGATSTANVIIYVRAPTSSALMPVQIIFFSVALCIGFLGSVAFATRTEAWRYRKTYGYMSGLTPIAYSKISEGDILNREKRAELFEYIKSNPGERLTKIANGTGMPISTAVYHLSKLEREGYVTSTREGMKRRFYPKGEKPLKDEEPIELTELQKKIIEMIKNTPGIRQHSLAMKLGTSERVISYNIQVLTESGIVNIIKDGTANQCYLIKEAETAKSQQGPL